MLPEPNMSVNLDCLLDRFRQELVAMMTDIESMFYQVKIGAEGRDFLRFLWFPGGDLKGYQFSTE